MSEIPIDQFKACQDKPCWKCEATEGSKDKCMAHTLQPLFGRVYDMETKLEDYGQGQKEWEERAEKAEAKVKQHEKDYVKLFDKKNKAEADNKRLREAFKEFVEKAYFDTPFVQFRIEYLEKLEKALSEGGA